jgi:hypothetical protein
VYAQKNINSKLEMSKSEFNAKKFESPGLTEDKIKEINKAFDLYDTNRMFKN